VGDLEVSIVKEGVWIMKSKGRLHIRRCHICEGVTESDEGIVDRCEHCGKNMAPFFFFDEKKVEPQDEAEIRTPWYGVDRKPIQGLTAYW
jgi:hypothetical protein